jgi:hypothetical protein
LNILFKESLEFLFGKHCVNDIHYGAFIVLL